MRLQSSDSTKMCPKCGIEHSKAGKFCCRSCANSRGPRNEDFKRKVRSKLLGKQTAVRNTGKRKWKVIQCESCGTSREVREGQRFCSISCVNDFNRRNAGEYRTYKQACKFKFNVYEYPDRFDLSLIEEHGWYEAANRGNNLEGVSRDHMISVRDGFKLGVSPDSISHPANCQLMVHRLNQRKNAKSSSTVEELQKRIENWPGGR